MDELFGRDEERGRLQSLLKRGRTGMSGAIVLCGAPGVGKSALLDHVQAVAEGSHQILRFDAVDSEAELGYAALHHLLAPHLFRLPGLPLPQRNALGRIFGLQDHSAPPDRLLVGVAALGLLTAAAAEQPLLCLVDDAQWLDEESAVALGFVARRMYAESLTMIFAVREGIESAPTLRGLPSLPVDPLPARHATQLLEAVVDGALDTEVRDRIVSATTGNPLALIEAVRELSPAQLSGVSPLPDPVPLGQAIEKLYVRETLTLPAGARALLLAAAADPTGDPNVLWRAGALLDYDADAAAPAEEQNLLTIRDRVTFRHPLIRAAVYHAAPTALRVRTHAVLADVAGDLGNTDLRAWHLASAATRPDDAVAMELEAAAHRTLSRGGWAAASTLLARSAALTTDLPSRAHRLLSAAEASVVAGAPGRGQPLLDAAAAYQADQHHNGQVQRVQARIHRLAGDTGAAAGALLSAARQLAPIDIRMARDILVEAVVQAQIGGSLAPAASTRRAMAQLIRDLPLPPAMDRTPGDALLDADATLHIEGIAAAAVQLHRAIDEVRQAPATAPELFQWLAAACAHATLLGDDTALNTLAWRMEKEARTQGAAIPLALALSHTAVSELVAGRIREAEILFDKRSAWEEARGNEDHIGALLIAAWRGQYTTAQELDEIVTQQAARNGQGYQLVFRDYARSVVSLSQGRYAEALGGLEGCLTESSQLKFAICDMVEAAVRCGRQTQALSIRDYLQDLAKLTPVPALLGDLARADALVLEDDASAEPLYLEAIQHHENTRGPGRRARSHHLYGEWLRRGRRTKEARHHLRSARDLFTQMGAAGYALRAAMELSAAGSSSEPRQHTPATDSENHLTTQESRVARLAADGATNAEIAAQLFLSVHTVDYHLRKVFKKLGVHSRRELQENRKYIGS
ncbi:regulatory protein, luxR family [Streptomyces sp. 3213]|uniref:AAA family ATPase n=1 Tax=Streptomyces sp. 3213.3 TaxID=1855348 RepID=UPI0008959EED|nr:LuxR family transcriptional regulator [Streptomyces sp. 3213.3]SEC74673.1 regulatory protein, luxR family [Streptomyces sp. 3213] [Streptomyces sp. 3213.3]